MELKKRQLAKLLHFYLEMELNILVIFLKVKSQDKVWKNMEMVESTKEISLKVKCMALDA